MRRSVCLGLAKGALARPAELVRLQDRHAERLSDGHRLVRVLPIRVHAAKLGGRPQRLLHET
jgi:hypothetical protein